MAQVNLSGMGVALVTPFNSQKAIDFSALSHLIDYQISQGADYIVVLGTTSENPTLEPDERLAVRRFVADKVGGRCPLVLGLGGNNTASIVRELLSLDPMPFSAILSVVPYYNKPSQEGIYQHYRALAEASPLPLVLYNVPGRTGVNMTADTTLRIAHEIPGVVAVKEASGNLDQARAILDGKPEDFTLLSGDDASTLALIKMGAKGVISVIGNALPAQFSRMVHAALDGDMAMAESIDNGLKPIYPLLGIDGNPAGVKSLLHIMGLVHNELRLPLVAAREATYQALERAMQEFAL